MQQPITTSYSEHWVAARAKCFKLSNGIDKHVNLNITEECAQCHNGHSVTDTHTQTQARLCKVTLEVVKMHFKNDFVLLFLLQILKATKSNNVCNENNF